MASFPTRPNLVFVTAVAAFLVVSAPATVKAQSCNKCEQCEYNRAKGVPAPFPDILELDGACAMGQCSQAIPCPGDFAAASQLDKLVHMKDIQGLLAFLGTGNKQVEFVPSRNAIAIHGCGESLLALFTLPKEMRWMAMVAVREPTVTPSLRLTRRNVFDVTSSPLAALND